jgi:ABC-type multidrug transport system fused ATPase/permease subunit
VAEIVRIAQEIRVFGVSPAIIRKVDDSTEEASGALVKTRFLLRLGPGVYQTLVFAMIFGAMGIIAAAHVAGVAALGAVVVLLVRGILYGQGLQQSQQGSAEILPYLHEVRGQIDAFERCRAIQGDQVLNSIETVTFTNVSFSYDPESAALEELNFHLTRGQALGLVGPTGAGKSTLVQLLLRLRDPDIGEYTINSDSAINYSFRDLYREIAFVPQEPQLIRGTVAENIRFFREDISDERVHRAAALAHLDKTIGTWDGGYDREIGDGASNLSGGQKQLLSIARALVGEPSMVILDEPTSGLDPQSELLVRESLEALKGNVIMVIIAHRLSTLEFCDRIMVIEGGRITALGTRDDLAETSPFLRVARQLSTLP